MAQNNGAVPGQPLSEADTAAIGLAARLDRISERFSEHTRHDEKQNELIHSRVTETKSQLEKVKRMQWMTAGGIAVAAAFLVYFVATMETAVESSVQKGINSALKENGLRGIRVSVQALKEQMDEKASKESVDRVSDEIKSLNDKAHRHRRR